MNPKTKFGAFTMIELILAITIMALLTMMAVPVLAQFSRTTKVQQAVQAINTALFHARNEAQRQRKIVCCYIGDDLAQLNPQPTPGILPPKGRIEIWTVLTAGGDYCGASEVPLGNLGGWYPYKDKDRDLTPGTITLPDGVRVCAGAFQRVWNGGTGTWDNEFYFGGTYLKSSLGELKRHYITYARNGGMPSYDTSNSYYNLLVYDQATGEHAVIWCGEWHAAARPRVLPYPLTMLGNTAGKFQRLKSAQDIPTLIDSWCLN